MARFYARLENEAGDFRFITLWAADEDEARKILKRRELKLALHRLPAERAEEIEAKVEDGSATKAERVALQYHAQEEPYEVVYVGTERKPGGAE